MQQAAAAVAAASAAISAGDAASSHSIAAVPSVIQNPATAPALATTLVPTVTSVIQMSVPTPTPAPTPAVVAPTNPGCKVYIGSVHWDVKEEDIRVLFSPFGPLKSCSLMPNTETGKHKGYGFIEYEKEDSAVAAIKQMNGSLLCGRAIKVGHAISGVTSTPLSSSIPVPVPILGAPALPLFVPGLITPGLQIAPSPAMLSSVHQAQVAAAAINSQNPKKEKEESLSWEDDIKISSNQRLSIMQKLAREPEKNSRCISLRNMVTPEELDDELETEVGEEASKYGEVEKVIIYTPKQVNIEVLVLILFKETKGATNALQKLNNRWFAGRLIKAEYFDEDSFLIISSLKKGR
eukprot:TRINITY_DN6724_c0_g1_i4.p1 TRINITY_DN6724_c0_g1~~TRINITY_DN6724_c0_g1_i4.p1  ORF type:complete len:350 (-),score=67.69 TRINITY_DN6724_c0_g1_i4:67-1116(-)